MSDAEQRAILAFGTQRVAAIPTNPDYKSARPPQPRRPGRGAQAGRLLPQFAALQTALATGTSDLGEAPNSQDPEFIVVFELAGTVDGFIRAIQGVGGLAFITDFVGDGIEPDDEFYNVDEDGERIESMVRQTLYLVMANSAAIDELVRLFALWQANPKAEFATGLAPLRQVFAELHTVRRWGPQDRIAETGLLEDLLETIDVVGGSGSFPVEVELVWRDTPDARQLAQGEVERALGSAAVQSTVVIESIRYHAVLAEITADEVLSVVENGPESVELFRVDEVLFVSSAVPMSLPTNLGQEYGSIAVDDRLPTGSPVVALLDGLPLANHDLLTRRIVIDDPEDRAAQYTPSQCGHGTTMASLIVHGDLSDPGPALDTPLLVEPVLVPHSFVSGVECPPPNLLLVDVIHSAFVRLFEGDKPTAPSVRIVNLSLGDPSRVFSRRLSPLARLLDYVAFKFNLLVVVSAGNHGDVAPVVPRTALGDASELSKAVRIAVHGQARVRRLLAPAEAINALTVGALHADGSTTTDLPDTVLDPLAPGSVALYSPSGSGFRRSPKPEIHAPGGRSICASPAPGSVADVALERVSASATGPGILAAAPSLSGSTTGTSYSCGTSNAAALVSRSAHRVLRVLESLEPADGEPAFPDSQYFPVLAKALLVHASSWPDEALTWADDLGASAQNRRRILTQHLGFGALDPTRLLTATSSRVTLIGAGSIGNNKRHSFRFPLPPSLSSEVGWRRLTVTLAWLSPTVPSTQQYRVAHLAFDSPRDDLRVSPTQADHVMNGKGTVLHEVLEGRQAAGYAVGTDLAIDVDCRVRVGRLYAPVRFGLAATLEVGPTISVDLHEEVRTRLREVVRAPVQATVRS